MALGFLHAIIVTDKENAQKSRKGYIHVIDASKGFVKDGK